MITEIRRATVLLLLIAGVLSLSAAAPRPNILVILADDVGYSDIGCYGSEIKTPNLDRLASNGLRFTQFYNTARCCPTRASLLTGLYPHQAGVGHMVNDRGVDGYRGELNQRCVTMAEVMRSAGYSTYMAGKWHVTENSHMKPGVPHSSWPLQRGFDRYYGTITGAGNYFDPSMLTRDNKNITALTDSEYRPAHYYYTDALADNTVRFIREHRERTPDKPFFFYLAFTAGHWPLHALEEDIAKYHGKYDSGYEAIRKARLARMKQMGLVDPKWEPAPLKTNWNSVSNKAWEARCMEVYAAQLDRMDQGIGRVMDELRRTGALDNTLILYMQDNGACAEGVGRQPVAKPRQRVEPKPDDYVFVNHRTPHIRDGRPYRVGPGAMPGPEDTYIAYGESWASVGNTPFREYKHWVHEGGISTPLIAHWPKGIANSQRGKLEAQPGHLIDIMATCVDVAGAKYPKTTGTNAIKPMEGVSLAPAFRGKNLKRENPIFWEHEGNRAVRDGQWKLVAKENKPWELFDLKADRTEQHDLMAREPKRAQKMVAQWDAYAARANVLPLGAWRGGGKSTEGLSTNTLFTLNDGDHLERADAPNISGRAFMLTATFDPQGKDGVIVAQGGNAHGYSLFVEDGKVSFAFRRASALTTVSVGEVSSGKHVAKAQVSREGELTLRLDGNPAATKRAAGALTQMPGDGLDVGADEGGLVAPYRGENAFGGVIESVEIRLE